MSLSSSTKKTTQSSETDPWDVTIPDLTSFLGRLREAGSPLGGMTDKQTQAVSQLESTAGNPFTDQIGQAATNAFNATSRAPEAEAAYGSLQQVLTPYATGQNNDPMQDPALRAMLTSNSNDITNRINSQFAASGRIDSGLNQDRVAHGITQATLPVLVQQYNDNRNRQLAAAGQLQAAGLTTANSAQALDQNALQQQQTAIPITEAYTTARQSGPNAVLNLEEQVKQLPVQELGQLAQILFGEAQLGQQSTGQSTSKQSGFGIGLGSIGSLFSGFGGLK